MGEGEAELGLQIILCSGLEAPHRAVFAFMAALSAAASGLRVSLVLTMSGACWASTAIGNDPLLPGYPSPAEYLENLQELGGLVEGCSTCVENFCPAPLGEDGLKVLRPGISRVGLTEVTLRMPKVRTVSF